MVSSAEDAFIDQPHFSVVTDGNNKLLLEFLRESNILLRRVLLWISLDLRSSFLTDPALLVDDTKLLPGYNLAPGSPV